MSEKDASMNSLIRNEGMIGPRHPNSLGSRPSGARLCRSTLVDRARGARPASHGTLRVLPNLSPHRDPDVLDPWMSGWQRLRTR